MSTRIRRLVSVRGLSVMAMGAVAALAFTACSTGSSDPAPAVTITKEASVHAQSTAPTTPSPPPSTSAPTGKPVHIKTLNTDGQTYGVAMPIIAYFSRKITSGKSLAKDTKVTVNGKPLSGAWYFETSSAIKGYPIEGHWRPKHFWPAHSRVHVDLPMKGKAAGKNLVYNDSLTLDFAIGPKHVVKVYDGASPHLIVTNGRKRLGPEYPVSLGAHTTPTKRGTKVIMEQLKSICMSGNPPNAPAYHECHVKWDQRLTYGGEYLHAAPWNCTGFPGCRGPANNIGHGDSSNGCTNLHPQDAKKLWHQLNIGDPVEFPNASGPEMQMGEGYGDWNLSWRQWRTGGLVSTA